MRIAALLYDPPDEEITMNMKYALCGIALAALVTPALAAGPFYVVQNIATKECSIVENIPRVSAMIPVGTAVYKTHSEAEIGMKADNVCRSK
jgi:hypothetical protein